MHNVKKCQLLIIGDEILSGRVSDQNLQFLCRQIHNLGMIVDKAHILSDNAHDITECLYSNYQKYSYIFTTGGLGPTHDDVTLLALSSFVQKANYDLCYLNDIQDIQQGKKNCAFIKIANIFAMPGVPELVRTAFIDIHNIIKTENSSYNIQIIEKEIDVPKSEKEIISIIFDTNNKFPNVKLGSYPFIKHNINYTKIVFTATNHESIIKAYKYFQENLIKQ